ncbi:MlaD family protein [Nocardia donostiensis]|uniref:Mammalian cell entry protein n=1 Tax=Nocardia donostiensis TaxID=1538463 RepID=A0A1W0BAT5_9NOCA|nr:MCE family protein [Nocardia donostiensis]ONM49046.1 mammalian cell entry protein [Nocardia donostiensis]OQS14063.1 mammalian cell entry protein [Nocardia donostiensis]OQS19526.1 mammalian cell entry protein [Nocardia donostiensis]
MIIDPSGRGPTMRQLLIAGICGLLVFAVVLGFLMARYQGYFVDKVKVVANLTTTGDGLPEEADVKFRGLLVGTVDHVTVAAKGELQEVHIDLKPEFVENIPANVTARVVPSNLFAVTAVELLYNGPADAHVTEGMVIEEDRSKGTIALQDTLTTVRNILTEIDPMQLGRVLGTLSYALDGSGRVPGSTIERLDRWLTAVDESIPDLGVLLEDFSDSAHALNESAPELMDVLASSVTTARTIADRRTDLVNLIAGAGNTVDRVNDLFARNPNIGKDITAGTNALFGSLAADPGAITRSISNLNDSARKLRTTFTWGPQQQMVWNAGLSFTPFLPNTVADCPRYGELAGPSCFTAPAVADPGYLPESMQPGRLASAEGLPLLPPLPGLPAIPGLTTQAGEAAAPAPAAPPNPFAGTPLEGLFPHFLPPAPPPAPAPAAGAAPAAHTDSGPEPGVTPAAKPIAYEGDAALTALLGRRPTSVEYLMLSSILEGGTLRVTEEAADR